MQKIKVFERGCGYPKEGGFYAIGGGDAEPCFALPAELVPCTCCDQLPQFSRSPQKVTHGYLRRLFDGCLCGSTCIRSTTYWLSFIGSDYTAKSFNQEVTRLGMSRRIQPSFRTAIKPGHVFANVKGNKIISLVPVTCVRYYVKPGDSTEHLIDLKKDGIEVCEMEVVKPFADLAN